LVAAAGGGGLRWRWWWQRWFEVVVENQGSDTDSTDDVWYLKSEPPVHIVTIALQGVKTIIKNILWKRERL
jgi:hypothetical protein